MLTFTFFLTFLVVVFGGECCCVDGLCFVTGDFARHHSFGTEGEVSVFGGVWRSVVVSGPFDFFDTACFVVFCDDEMPVDSFFDGGSGDECEPFFVIFIRASTEGFLPELANIVFIIIKLGPFVKLLTAEAKHIECSGVDGEGFIFFGEFFFVAVGANEFIVNLFHIVATDGFVADFAFISVCQFANFIAAVAAQG